MSAPARLHVNINKIVNAVCLWCLLSSLSTEKNYRLHDAIFTHFVCHDHYAVHGHVDFPLFVMDFLGRRQKTVIQK